MVETTQSVVAEDGRIALPHIMIRDTDAHSCITSSDGAAASIFNSYRDIPVGCLPEVRFELIHVLERVAVLS